MEDLGRRHQEELELRVRQARDPLAEENEALNVSWRGEPAIACHRYIIAFCQRPVRTAWTPQSHGSARPAGVPFSRCWAGGMLAMHQCHFRNASDGGEPAFIPFPTVSRTEGTGAGLVQGTTSDQGWPIRCSL